MSLKEIYDKQGYIILKDIFSEEEINKAKEIILEYKKNNKLLSNSSGYTIANFIDIKDLEYISTLKDNSRIHETLKVIFNGDNYRFCSHNDIGINRIVGWHKDKLNGIYEKFQKNDIWKEYNNEKHEIVKVLIYLENHDNTNDGLKLVPGSHLVRFIDSSKNIKIKSNIGDVIIFDQRITHRGNEKQVKDSRILVSFGFGKNNIFTDNFEKGTIARQNNQNNQNKKK